MNTRFRLLSRSFEKKGDIAVSTMAVLILVIIAVSLFIIVLLIKFPSISKSFYCKTISPIKTFFLPDYSKAEESYCKEINELNPNILKKETAHQRYFYEKKTIKEIQFPDSGGSSRVLIRMPKSQIEYAEFNISGFLEENITTFSDGEKNKTLIFKGRETKQINITIPKKAYVKSVTMNLSGNKTHRITNVLVFTGYSKPPGCRVDDPIGCGDHVEAYLDYHRIKYDTTHGWRQRGEEPDWRKKFENHSILFVGCGLNLITTNPDDREFLKEWIAKGNTLFASCWAINLIVDLFGTGDVRNGYTPYITRITPYQDCPSECPDCSDPRILTCQPTVGHDGKCGDSQRMQFTEEAAKLYGVDPDKVVTIIYEGSHCAYKTDPSNPNVTILARLIYDPNNPKDRDIKLKCADKNNGNPGDVIFQFKYGNGTVIYMTPHMDDQLHNELGETNFLINAINKFLPKVSNLSLSVSNSSGVDWNLSGSLEKPTIVGLNVSRINKILRECEKDKSNEDENCTITLNITAQDGVLLVNHLIVSYEMPVYNVSVEVDNNEVFKIENLSRFNTPIRINNSVLKKGINDFLSECDSYTCFIPLNVSAGTKGVIMLSGLDIIYKRCLVREEIVANALACWERANFGKSNKDISCYEITIPEKCGAVEDTTEEDITELLLKNKLCDILPNNDVDVNCGKSDKIDWRIKHVFVGRNILIRYSSDERKIIIS